MAANPTRQARAYRLEWFALSIFFFRFDQQVELVAAGTQAVIAEYARGMGYQRPGGSAC
jgi:hypothetical protein